MIAAYAGLRAGEIRGLTWSDVDIERAYLVVRRSICRGETSTPKSGNARIVPLAAPVLEELSRGKRGKTNDPVSVNAQGDVWSEFGLLQAFQRAMASLDLFRAIEWLGRPPQLPSPG